MDIPAFLRNIMPTFTRNDVLEKIKNISKKLLTIVRPSYDLMVEALDESQFKSAFAKSVAKDFSVALPTRLKNERRPVTTFLPKAITHAQQLLDSLEQYVGKNLAASIHIEGINYQKATVLRLIELLDFFSDYSIRHLAYITASETNIDEYGRPDGLAFTPDELRFLETNRGTWIKLMAMLQDDPKGMLKQVNDIPEIVLGDMDIGAVPALAGASADPLHLGLIPLVSNIFRWVGIRHAHWELDRFERAVKEKRIIELRLEARRERLAGRQDAGAEAIVNNYENELVLIRERIKEMERKMEIKAR
jgi:hypothetical protein